MFKKIIFAGLGLLGLLILIKVFFKGPQIEVAGRAITLNTASHRIEGWLGSEETLKLVIKDLVKTVGVSWSDASIAVLRFDKAQELTAKYGNIFRCTSKGATAAKQNIELVRLISENSEIKDSISQAVNLVKKAQNPVVTIQASRLNIKKQTYLKMKVNDSSGIQTYYVKALQIVQASYP